MQRIKTLVNLIISFWTIYFAITINLVSGREIQAINVVHTVYIVLKILNI